MLETARGVSGFSRMRVGDQERRIIRGANAFNPLSSGCAEPPETVRWRLNHDHHRDGGVGAGKTTIGIALARELGWRFVDGDDLHPASNVAKMARDEPLTDADRAPWLDAIRGEIVQAHSRGVSLVVACSALKERYQRQLAGDDSDVVFAFLKVSREVLEQRLAARTGHFAGPGLLASQLASLEEPGPDAIVIDAEQPPDRVVLAIRAALRV